MNRHLNKGIRSGPFRRDGHRTTTNWEAMIRDKKVQQRLDADTARLRAKYLTRVHFKGGFA